MSIKASVKEHLTIHFTSSPRSRHWMNHISHFHGLNDTRLINESRNLLLKKFTYKDIAKCAELFKEVFSSYPWYDKWVSLNQAKNYIVELVENPVFEGFVAYENSQIVAVCFGHKRSWWMGKEFFIDEFYVRNECQGNGIGTKLLNYVKKSLSEEDYGRLVLLTNKGIPAEEFYIKNGFYTNNDRINMIKEL